MLCAGDGGWVKERIPREKREGDGVNGLLASFA